MTTPFEITAPLPQRRTVVLEASAGTGKTWTIAALATRYLAEGVIPLPELLVVTFNRTAAHDLRTTIRGRLVAAAASLTQAHERGTTDSAHPVDQLLADAEPSVVIERLTRLRAALADFDAATISTIHGYCDDAAAQLGVLGDGTPHIAFADSLADLAHQVASDLYLRAYAAAPAPEGFSFTAAREIAALVVAKQSPFAPGQDPNAVQMRFARAVRAEVQRRRRALGRYTHDDKISALAAAVADETVGARVRAALRRRHTVVLVDEFQDTDDLQWRILGDTFGDRDVAASEQATLILIGDPKQAIYGFRGGEVNAYLRAVGTAQDTRTLGTNHRSDVALVEALTHLLVDIPLGSDRIRVHPVEASHPEPRIAVDDPELAAPLRIRVLTEPGPKHRLESVVRDDVVADARALLARGMHTAASRRPGEPLRPGDIAILVRSNALAESYRAALARVGIAAVHAGATNVYTSPAGDDWTELLAACETPDARAVRRVALTNFVGWTLADLVGAGDDEVNELAARVRGWSTRAATSIADLMQALASEGLAARLLGQRGGDRVLTDLRHIGQTLHAAQRRHHLGIAGLRTWLAEQREIGSETSRRLETDADAVQISTIHRAKGLQFPVVYAPDLWSGFFHFRGLPAEYADAEGRHLQILDSPIMRARIESLTEQAAAGEDLRLAYVALTRAESQLIVHWAASGTPDRINSSRGALHRILQADATSPAPKVLPRVPAGLPRVQHPGISCRPVTHLAPPAPDAAATGLPALGLRVFQRTLDAGWRRSSYSSLTRDAHAAGPVVDLSEQAVAHADALLDDVDADTDPLAGGPIPDTDPIPDTGPGDAADPAQELVSPLADLPRGPAFGTLVHAVLEDFDPGAPDLRAELLRHCEHWAVRLPSLGVGAETLADALLPVTRTPLGPIADDLRLCDIPAHDRLPELDFEMPLAGGQRARPDRPGVTLGEVADLLEEHLAPGDVFHDYPAHLRVPGLRDQELRGFLTGSIDAVLRLGTPRRYLVVDYKTNWLLPPTDPGPLLLTHYTPRAMTRSMIDSHYPLQALLYSVALHRFLRWRIPGYRAADALGGVAYLYVRGMGGPDTPMIDQERCGVLTWRPPASMIEILSDRIDRAEERA